MRRLLPLLLVLLTLPLVVHAQEDDEPTCEDIAPAGAAATYYAGLGDALTAQGNFTGAIFAFDCAIERNPTYPPAYVNRGVAHAAQFNFTAALADYNTAIEQNSNLISAYNNRGVLYSREANYALAIADFTLLTTLTPDFAPAYHNRALVEAAEGNYDLAIEDLQQAIILDPTYAAPHRALSAVYLMLALESGAEYEALSGLPNDTDDLLRSLDETRTSGDPSVWVVLQTPVQE